MKAAFAILVCCLVALLPESRTDTLTEVRPPNYAQICRDELKLDDRSTKDLIPGEQEREHCSLMMCILKKREDLEADDNVFNEEIYLKYAQEHQKEDLLKFLNDCKAKASGNSCKFVNCVSKIQLKNPKRN